MSRGQKIAELGRIQFELNRQHDLASITWTRAEQPNQVEVLDDDNGSDRESDAASEQ